MLFHWPAVQPPAFRNPPIATTGGDTILPEVGGLDRVASA